MLPSAWDDIRTLVEQKPEVQLQDMQYFIFGSWSVRISIAHISHTLKKMKISKRSLLRVAPERSQECQN